MIVLESTGHGLLTIFIDFKKYNSHRKDGDPKRMW